jgi:hypothetical protein
MNETSWRCCTDPALLLRFGQDDLAARKLRLFACHCVRRVWPLLTREAVRKAVETAERFADGAAERDELRAGWQAVRKALSTAPLGTRWEDALMAALDATSEQLSAFYAGNAARSAALALDADWRKTHAKADRPADRERMRSGSPEERARQCKVLRDLLPFEPVEVDPAWRAWAGGQVVALAQTIYDEQRWQDLPVLADALEEAGCADERVLLHCRGGALHARGCWLVDRLLDKE